MKKLLLLSFLASAAMIEAPKADTLPAPIIAIVEQATLDKSAAFKSIIQQVEKKRAEVQKEMASYENELKAQDTQLVEDQKKLSEKDFAPKRQAFEKRVHEVQEKLEIRRAQLEIAVEDAKKKVYEAFLKVSEEVMKEVGANMIVYKETIVTANPALDLTAKVLANLDKTLPTVQVSYKSDADVKKQLQQQGPAAQPPSQ